ncbi:Ig-like domain-containing protein [Deinococcus cellulosilyticus]|uniref:Uncharacterized protein n=1 Tax=Deinococcus cellulosilyticus (strain DSM 18568 / NBRC 106333 / KACC 11606 / 5516J-15) TaxID=1223518 RepID=A0A511N860_DEIC1|nr:Ig-like domain-containing protein [Deinococcus cellulosilyticus]GEM48666.1 hypothetical protein DC3_43010 [Deinococcus cellulosilyticus NBRC 106333 = KACC 11606]
MADITASNSPVFKTSSPAFTSDTDAHASIWNSDKQIFLDNDAYLKKEIDLIKQQMETMQADIDELKEGGGTETIPPTVTLTANTTNITYQNDQLVLTATASDASGIKQVQFWRVYEDNNNVYLGADNSAPYTNQQSYTGLVGSGTQSYRAKAIDMNNNEAWSNTIVVTYNMAHDNTPPTVTLAESNGKSSFNTPNSTLSLVATASDNETVSKVEFYRNGSLVATDLTPPFTYTETYQDATDNGTFTYHAKAFDIEDNSSQSNNVVIAVNIPNGGTGPSTTLSVDDTTPRGGSQTIRFTAVAEDVNGVSKVEFLRDGVLQGTVTTFPFVYDFEYVSGTFASGSHTWTAVAYDTFNNPGTSNAVVVNYNMFSTGTQPTVDLAVNNNFAESTSAYGSIPLEATYSDNEGVTSLSFWYSVNNGTWTQFTGVGGDPSPGSHSYSTSKSITAGQSGRYRFRVEATDADGNIGHSPIREHLVLIPGDAGHLPAQGTSKNTLAAAPGWYRPVALVAGQLIVPPGASLYITDWSFKYTPDNDGTGQADIEVAYMDYDHAGDMIAGRATVLGSSGLAGQTSGASGSSLHIYTNSGSEEAYFNLYVNIKNPQDDGGSSVRGTVVYDFKVKLQ